MTSAGAEHPRADSSPLRPTVAATAGSRLALPRGCPFLVAAAGGWRLDAPSADHRCAAFSPAAPLAPEKQGRLCLTDTHTGCATYLASLGAREARLGAPPRDRTTRWGLARTTTVIQDSGGLRARVLAAVLDRRRWPAIPAVLLVTTLFTLALSGFRAGIPASPVATSSPAAPAFASGSPAAVTGPSMPAATDGPVITDGPVPTDERSPSPAAPTRTTSPSALAPTPAGSFRTYTVTRGDTLSAIAAQFGTTVQALTSLNNLSDPGSLSIGQVLLIP